MNTSPTSSDFIPDEVKQAALAIVQKGAQRYRQSVADRFALNQPGPSELTPVIASYASAHSIDSKSYILLEPKDSTNPEQPTDFTKVYSAAGTATLEEGPIEMTNDSCHLLWSCSTGILPLGVIFIQNKSTGETIGKARFLEDDGQHFIELEEGTFSNLQSINSEDYMLIIAR